YNVTRWQPPAHIDFNNVLGDGANWRHNWNWTILDDGTNAYGPSIRVVYPNGFYGNFAYDSASASNMTFLANTHERVWQDGTNFYLTFLDGRQYHFTQQAEGSGYTYQMERLIDPYSNVYDYVYTSGLLSRVEGPNTNQSVDFTYRMLPYAEPAGTIQFSYTDGVATQVLIGGTFNGWSLQEMTLSGGSNWTLTTSLTNGFHQYKYVARYTTGEVWKIDPDNPVWCYDDSTNYNENSLAVIDPYRILDSVALSDGRTTTYHYGWVENLGFMNVLLTNVQYGGGTEAFYSYYHPSNDLWRRPLLETAEDPHYEGPGRAIRYVYQTNNIYSGQLYEEYSLATTALLSRLTIVDDTYSRIVVDADGNTNYLSYTEQTGQEATATNGVGYVSSNQYEEVFGFGEIGFLKKSWDEMGRVTEYTRTLHYGAIVTVSNAADGLTSNTYTDVNRPFYLSETVDGVGRTNRFTRDSLHRVTRHDYPDGSYITNAYNAHGQLMARRDRGGKVTTYVYDERGRRTSMTDPLGNTTTYGYDAYDRLATETNALGQVTSYTYNWRGQVTNVVYPDGTTQTMWYNDYGQRTQLVNRAGGMSVFAYDAYGYPSMRVDPAGATNTFTYSALGRLRSTTSPLGLTISNTYDRMGRRVQATYASDASYHVWQYDPDGVRTQINRLGEELTYQYNDDGRLEAMSDENGNRTGYGHDLAGNRTHVTNALSEETIYTYDSLGRQLTSQNCQGHVISNHYNLEGRLVERIDANGISTEYTYDAVGRRTSVLRAGLVVETNVYDAIGRVILHTDPNGITVSNSYDVGGRLLSTHYPDGSSTLNVYSNTFLVQRIDRAGRTTTYTRDPVGRVLTETDNATNTVTYQYDAVGNLTNLIDQAGNETWFTYDVEGRQILKTYNDGTTNAYGYDAEGRLTSRSDGKGVVTLYRYDAVGSLTNIDYATDADVFFSYDEVNRMLTMVDGIGTTVYAYAQGCAPATSVDGPFASDTVTYAYDPGNRLINLAVGAYAVTYRFDDLDRIDEVVYDGLTNAYNYLNQGRLVTAKNRENGTVSTYDYDALARLTNLVHATSAADVLRQFAYEVNDADLRTQVTREGGWRIDYAYDPIGQLVGAQAYNEDGSIRPGYAFGYTYDKTGNPLIQDRNGLITSNGFNSLNQNTTSRWEGVLAMIGYANTSEGEVVANGVTGTVFGNATFAVTNLPVVAGSNAYTAVFTDPFGRAATSTVSATAMDAGYGYDANGNLTNDGQHVYAWNEENRLIEVRDAGSGTVLMQSRYDGLGRRRERIEWVEGIGSTNRYVYDNWNVMRVLDESDAVLESYVHGPDLSGSIGGAGGIGGILSVAYTGDPEPWYIYHADGNGNVALLTDGAEQDVARIEYDPFGKVLVNSSTLPIRYPFSSKEYDASGGLNYYGYRFYSSQVMSWCSIDKLSDHASVIPFYLVRDYQQPVIGSAVEQVKYLLSTYRFSLNSPASYYDFLGMVGISGGGTEEGKRIYREVMGISDEEAEEIDKENDEMVDACSDAMKDMMLAPLPAKGIVRKCCKWLAKKLWKETDPGEDLPDDE
ncbi:MAG: hypothetical protein KDL31_04085, partial [Kiritimatiellae bacterium]|nr:hypothetical protein [Kiritimatiellia bacterium]